MKKIVGIGGLIKSGKSALADLVEGAELIDAAQVLNAAMRPGEEGFRQVVNYFGEEFLTKTGKLNLRKLLKFVSANHMKWRIFRNVVNPVVKNEIQKVLDASDSEKFILEGDDFSEQLLGYFTKDVLWSSKKTVLEGLDAMIQACQEKLYSKPDAAPIYDENSVEAALEFLYDKLDLTNKNES